MYPTFLAGMYLKYARIIRYVFDNHYCKNDKVEDLNLTPPPCDGTKNIRRSEQISHSRGQFVLSTPAGALLVPLLYPLLLPHSFPGHFCWSVPLLCSCRCPMGHCPSLALAESRVCASAQTARQLLEFITGYSKSLQLRSTCKLHHETWSNCIVSSCISYTV